MYLKISWKGRKSWVSSISIGSGEVWKIQYSFKEMVQIFSSLIFRQSTPSSHCRVEQNCSILASHASMDSHNSPCITCHKTCDKGVTMECLGVDGRPERVEEMCHRRWARVGQGEPPVPSLFQRYGNKELLLKSCFHLKVILRFQGTK